MPTSIVAAVVASAVASGVTGAVVFGVAITATAAQVIGAAAGFIVAAGLRSATARSQDTPSAPSFVAEAQQRTHVLRSPVANRQIIYGRAMVSGPLVFAASTNDNNTLYLALALAGHEVDGIEEIYFNDETLGSISAGGGVTDGRYTNRVNIAQHYGSVNQDADEALVAAGVGWTQSHRLRGVAYLRIIMDYDADVFPQGIPNIKAIVRGKKVYDPRTGLTAYSNNWALCVRDYLVSPLGIGADVSELDEASFIAAANISDEPVGLASGGTEPRYTANGVIDTSRLPRDAMNDLLSAGAGVLVWSAGKYRLHAGVYDAPTLPALGVDDLAGAVKVRTRVPRHDLFNAVRGTYVDPLKYWQPGDFPVVVNSEYASQDGAQIFKDLALPFTISGATAQRLARIILEKSRQGITVEMPCKLTAFKVSLWSTIRLTLAQFGWTDKEFKVVSWAYDQAGIITLGLQEESETCYAWAMNETIVDPAPDTDLPDPWSVAAPGFPEVTEALYETTGSAGVKAKVVISVAPHPDAFVRSYQFEWRPTGTSDWTVITRTSTNSVEVFDVAPGIYDIQVKVINGLGVSSPYSTRTAVEIRGLASPPADLTSVGIQAAGGLAILTWALHPDLDVRIGGKIRVRHSASLSGATWEGSVSIGEAVSGGTTVAVLPLKEGTYLLRPEDSSGTLSPSAVSMTTKQATALAWSSLLTVQEDDDFLGTHTNTAVSTGVLHLAGTGDFDSIPDFDAVENVDYVGGVASSGTYDFVTGMDLTTVQHVRLTSTIAAQAANVADNFDFRVGDIDSWEDFDGTAGAPVDAWVEVRYTDDDPAGSPTWSTWRRLDAAEFEARGFDFRCQLISADTAYTINITQLRVNASQIA